MNKSALKRVIVSVNKKFDDERLQITKGYLDSSKNTHSLTAYTLSLRKIQTRLMNYLIYFQFLCKAYNEKKKQR